MSRRPELGYFDEGLDLCAPLAYQHSRGEPGTARVLPLAAYRSLEFSYLEDERIWTRDWVCIGTRHDLPNAGDLLPYTLGNHGIHVQRQADGSLRGAFNQAQHGGCRVVPLQCQGGSKTSCSFTSCGYSRDRTPIQAGELGQGSPAMHQYLGLRPERLLPVAVATFGALVFVNIDPHAEVFSRIAHELPAALAVRENATRIGSQWREYACNWKLLAQHLLAADEQTPASEQALVFRGMSGQLDASWHFPNLLLLRHGSQCCVVLLQPTALGKTLCRIQLLSETTLLDAEATMDMQLWLALLDQRGASATAHARQLLRWDHPDETPRELPLQTDVAGLWGQQQLLDRITLQLPTHSDVQLFGNVRNYLI
ncbi:hypothetical protein [Pseudomonas lopnurensis]|uniref:hypothetical protein n=1 Tax=Pseudomonas lopnurensis TaxID=1477517 RepID=UPI0028A697E5|nr:hypothetical protein [Pseudomonas lopnurensis]